MDNFGLTETGFKRARYNDIVTKLETRAIELFGSNINLNERGLLGLTIRLTAWISAISWQLAEKVYLSSFVSTAESLEDLARIGQYIGISPRSAVFATGEVTFTGDENTEIPQATQVKTPAGLVYFTLESAVVPSEGSVDIPISAIEPGSSYNVPQETITELVNPISGITSISNGEGITNGLNAETAAEFRARYRDSVSAPGAATLNSIRASLLNVEGVRTAKVVENDTMDVDGEGRPPKSVEAILLGGDNQEIAETILDTIAGGIQSHGNVCETVIDDSGTERNICFSFATVVSVYANVTVTTTETYPAEGETQIKTAIMRYIGGQDPEGTVYPGLSMGDDVVYNRLISSILCEVPGIKDITLEIGTDGTTYNEENISIGDFEVSETDFDNLAVVENA